jgi:NTE family protein
MFDRPDVLVLGAGGTLGEAWMRGLLDGIAAESGFDFRECEYFVGTSAGSIVAATLAAGRAPSAGDRAAREWAEQVAAAEGERVAAGGDPGEGAARGGGDAAADEDGGGLSARFGAAARGARRAGVAAATPLVPAVLAGTAPLGRLARAAALRGMPRPRRSLPQLTGYLEGLGARFDGRLRIAVVDRGSGRRVMLGAPDAPQAHVAQAVLASCAIPWVFAPVEIAGRDYVDGGVWSPTNLDAAPAGRGARVLCLIPTAGSAWPGARRASTALAATEALAVRARGAQVSRVAPDAAAVQAIGPSLMDQRRRAAVAAAGYAQGRRLATASG